jgi:DNA modification methylase
MPRDKRAGLGRLTYNKKRQGEAGTGQEAFVSISPTRNKRSVWTIATHSYSGAHFATFPPKLVELCILAGCPVDGLVLDPFAGAGTVGLVANKLGRNATLIEINSDYCALMHARTEEQEFTL